MKDEDIDQRHAAAYHEAGQAVMVFYSRLSTGTRPHERMLLAGSPVGDIVRFRGPSARAAVAAIIKIEDAKTILAHRFNFRRAIGGVGSITMEIEDGWLAFPSRRMPSDQRNAIADIHLNLSDAV